MVNHAPPARVKRRGDDSPPAAGPWVGEKVASAAVSKQHPPVPMRKQRSGQVPSTR